MTLEELDKLYNPDNGLTADDFIKRHHETGTILNQTYLKHLPICWSIERIYGHVSHEAMSMGKARELTAGAIEVHINNLGIARDAAIKENESMLEYAKLHGDARMQLVLTDRINTLKNS